MFGPVGKAIGGGLKLGATLLKGAELLEKWNLTLRQADLNLAKYSGDMAKVMAEQQVWEIRFAQERGRARAGTARFREEGMRELRQGMAPFGDAFSNVLNVGLGSLAHIVTYTSPLLLISQAVQQILNMMQSTGEGPDISVGATFANVANAGWMEHYGRPLNFGNEWFLQNDPRP